MSQQVATPIMGAVLALILVFLLIVFFVGVGWVLPITLGIREARKKNYSALWMLFGIHPIGGWVAFIVLACMKPRVQCLNCGGFVKVYFRLCPFCHAALGGGDAPPPAIPVKPPPIPGQVP